MIFAIKPADSHQKQLIFNLLQPYLQELSRFPDQTPDYKDENGFYRYPYLEHYWQEDGRFPYLLYCETEIAGFALVRRDGVHWEMSEFYVKPGFRRRGLAMKCVAGIFEIHNGEWKILYNRRNQPGRELWNKLAAKWSKSKVMRIDEDTDHQYLCSSV